MARRGFGGMTALRAALGAAVGVGEGLQQREVLAAQRKKDEEAAALTRFNALQAAGFGFTPRRRPADLGAPGAGEMAPSAAPATATPIGSALSAATAGATPAPSTGTPMGAALGAAETRQPSLTPMGMLQEPVRVGGMEFDLIDPQEVARQRQAQQLSLYEQQRAVDARTAEQKRAAERAEKEADIKRTARLVQSTFRDRNGKPLSEDAAMFVAESGKTPIELGLVERPMTEAERQSMAARWSELALSRKRFAADQAQREAGGTAGTGAATPGGLDFTADLRAIQDFLPTVGPDGKIVPPRRKLDARKALAVQQGGPGGTFIGQLANLAATTFGADMTNEQLYNTVAEGIGTAYAIQEQRGRNVSDKDVANRVAQVKVLPSEIGSLEVQRLKAQRIQQMASLLMSGKVPQVEAGQTVTPPVFSPQTPQTQQPPQGASGQGVSKQQWGSQWMAQNPRRANEAPEVYARRMQQAWTTSQGGRQ